MPVRRADDMPGTVFPNRRDVKGSLRSRVQRGCAVGERLDLICRVPPGTGPHPCDSRVCHTKMGTYEGIRLRPQVGGQRAAADPTRGHERGGRSERPERSP